MLLFFYKKSRQQNRKHAAVLHSCARDIIGHHICQIKVEGDIFKFQTLVMYFDFIWIIGCTSSILFENLYVVKQSVFRNDIENLYILLTIFWSLWIAKECPTITDIADMCKWNAYVALNIMWTPPLKPIHLNFLGSNNIICVSSN